MGIVKATADMICGVAADQWKKSFLCDERGSENLMQRQISW